MDYHWVERSPKFIEDLRNMGSPFSLSASGGKQILNRPKLDKRNLSYADLHSEVVNDVKSMQTEASVSHLKQHAKVEATKREEVVKLISKLPAYQEKEVKVQDKPLNFGVSDWRSFEDWQYYHRKTPIRNSRYSSPNSTVTPKFHDSSNRQRRGQSSSPAGRKGRRPTLQSYLDLSSTDGHLEFLESSARNTNKFQDNKAAPTMSVDWQENIHREFKFFNNKPLEIELKKCNKKTLDHNSILNTKTSRNLGGSRASSYSKARVEVRQDESKKVQDQRDEAFRFVSPDKCNNVVLLLPRNGQKSKEHSRMSLQGFHTDEVCRTNSCTTNPRLLPHDIDGIQRTKMEQHISVDTDSLKFFPSPSPKMKSVSPAKNKLVERKPAVMPKDSIVAKSSMGSDIKIANDSSIKTRNPSPKGRLSIRWGSKDTSSGSQNSAAVPQFYSKNVAAKSRAESVGSRTSPRSSTSQISDVGTRVRASPLRRILDPLLKPKATNSHPAPQSRNASTSSKKASTSGILDAGTRDRSSPLRRILDPLLKPMAGKSRSAPPPHTESIPDAGTRDRSSPLRRILDPLLKPMASKSHTAPQSHSISTSCGMAPISANGKEDKSSVNPMNVKLDLTSLRTANLDVVRHSEKRGSSTVQAYLKVAVKNDLPLFTFAVDNNSVVLAATIKKFSTRKDDSTWIYTFFNVHASKKSSGDWLNYGPKNKEYIPNVIAQMKVSDLRISDSDDSHSADQLTSKEYVLFAVDLRLFDQQESYVEPNDELAAIVVKFKRNTPSSSKESVPPDVRGSSETLNFNEKLSVISHEVYSSTVILPGGAHGIPSKGEPSPLIDRWLSGGECDCGGWDLGCMVKVLGSKCQRSAGKFELFSQSQDRVAKCTPLFTLSSLNSGIFSVKFDSTISVVQAFSICIAALDSRKASQLRELSSLFNERLTGKTSALHNSERKSSNKSESSIQQQMSRIHPIPMSQGSKTCVS